MLLWLYLSGLVLLLAAVVNAVLLGEGEPVPKTGSDPNTTGDGTDRSDDRTDALRDRLHQERSRRQTLEHERARLARRLERTENADLTALRRRNRELGRWLAWKRRPLPARLLVRLLGDAPPKPDLRLTGRTTRGEAVEGRDRETGTTVGKPGTSAPGE